MSKHAYLIIAHNEFDVLKLLLKSLDDVRNDIYVHIDKKVRKTPELKVEKSELYYLEDRLDVRWGNYSQIKCEFLLWEAALANGPYDFYHMISGTHLPLKNQDEIHFFFDKYSGKSLFCNLEKREGDYQETLKLHRINVCTRTNTSSIQLISSVSQLIWKAFIALQRCLKIEVNDGIQFYWANNWCSLSQEAVDYLIKHKNIVLKRYRWSFCGDEWFAPTELMMSPICNSVISKSFLFNKIGRNNAEFLTIEDKESMVSSKCIFARKFSSHYMGIVDFVVSLVLIN